jgi:NADH:ubiquinone oxidoreductase subunit H
MDLGWKWLIPLAIANVLVTGVLVLVFGMGGPA